MSDASDILRELLEAVPDSYQKTIGFPTYDILAAAAIRLVSSEAELSSAKSRLDPENLSGLDLERYIFPRTGQKRTPATYSEGTLNVSGTGMVQSGSLFESIGGIQFEAVESVQIKESGTVPVRCRDSGSAGNLPPGSITMMPVQIPGSVSVTNEEATTGGYEAESDAAYYQRFLLRLQTPPTSGNRYHYLSWALETPGVGGARVVSLGKGANTVEVILIDNTGKPADESLVEEVQNYIDPGSNGLGEGEAPIGAYCYVSSAEEVKINVTVMVTPGVQADQETISQSIWDTLAVHLGELALTAYATAKGSAENGYLISYSRVGALLLEVDGVEDYRNLRINDGINNIRVQPKQAAILGEVTVSYDSAG